MSDQAAAQKQEKKQIYKPKPISGYPEWLPEFRAVEQDWMDRIRKVFESYGFCSIETPSVEELDVILAKGATDQEIYTITRLQADEDEEKEARLGLHPDLTVPMARYVAMRFNDLDFPFKRYQMQRVWRGERAQKGRFREFYQCDIDVVNVDNLPLHFDAEMPAALYDAFRALDIPPVEIRLSNRKILVGYLTALGIQNISETTQALDKIDKIGAEAVIKALTSELGLDQTTAEKAIALADIKTSDTGFVAQVKALNISNETLEEGLEELEYVFNNLQHLPQGSVKADLSIVRGLNYYTGTVIEAYFQDAPELGAIGAGGRYDDLASNYINKNLPGIGVSIGLSRLFFKMLEDGKIESGRKCPTDILVVLPSDEQKALASETANILRKRGYNVELYHAATKLNKQLSYAEKKGIPYVWFPPFEEGKAHEVKNMDLKEQKHADPNSWEPEA